jgi:serine/threonine-protein kinase
VDLADKVRAGLVKRIGKYDIIEELGHGGMGVVYRCTDPAIGREVAIKTLTEGFAEDPSLLARFYDELRITGNLSHPNIVTVYEAGDMNGTPYIVMECVKGRPLDKVLAERGFKPLSDRLRIVEETCRALGYAHQNNVIHRDVKPANIFVLPDGNAKLLDFGIARLEKRDSEHGHTRVGNLIGTIPYMAPERLRNETLDGRSDIFAVGVVLYQLVAGQLPFTGIDTELMQKILQKPAPTMAEIGVECPRELEFVLDRALAKDPADRYSTAEEMAAELSAIISELRQGEVEELLVQAREMVAADQLAQARTVLNQVVTIDNKNAAAKELLAHIQGQFMMRKRELTAQQVRQQAEEAFVSKRYEQCLAVLEGCRELFSAYPDLEALRARAKKEKDKQDRVNELLGLIESARRKGDFKSAILHAEKARKADKTNPRIAQLCNQLTAEAEQAQRQAQAKILLNAARADMNARRFNEAVELLHQVEALDPTHPELALMLADAKNGLEQGRRREVISRLEDEVSQASTMEQLQQVAESIQGAMAEMPTESALFRLSAQVERLVRDQQNRRLVENTLLACKELRPREALDRVRQAQAQVPGEERLMSLEALLLEKIRQQTVDERRAEYLARARESLANQQYGEAVRVLELCDAEGIASSEILTLLDFAHNELRDRERIDQLRSDMAQAQTLIGDSEFDQAIEFLEHALSVREDPALRMLLDQATTGREAQQQRISAALASAANFIQSGKLDESLQFLQKQPRPVQLSPRVQHTLSAIEEERQQAVFRTIGRAYAALDFDLPASDALLRQAQSAVFDPALCVALANPFRERQQAFADGAVAEAVRGARKLVKERNKEGAERLLMTVTDALSFASPQVRGEWETAHRKATSSGLFRMR